MAYFPDGNYAENDLNLRIKVQDVNDNSPVFGTISPGSVEELSPKGEQHCPSRVINTGVTEFNVNK